MTTLMLYRTGSGSKATHTVVAKDGLGVRVAYTETIATRSYNSLIDALQSEQKLRALAITWNFVPGTYYSEAHYGVLIGVAMLGEL